MRKCRVGKRNKKKSIHMYVCCVCYSVYKFIWTWLDRKRERR